MKQPKLRASAISTGSPYEMSLENSSAGKVEVSVNLSDDQSGHNETICIGTGRSIDTAKKAAVRNLKNAIKLIEKS